MLTHDAHLSTSNKRNLLFNTEEEVMLRKGVSLLLVSLFADLQV